MKFFVNPIIEGKITRLHAERIYADDIIERFKVTGSNKSITLQTNQLLFRSRELKHHIGQWEVIDEHVHKTQEIEKIIEAQRERGLDKSLYTIFQKNGHKSTDFLKNQKKSMYTKC